MREFRSIFDLGSMWLPKSKERELRLLLVTSTNCRWCDIFKPLYKELEEQLVGNYELYQIEAENVGGRAVFREGFHFFFRVPNRAFPSLYIVEPAHSITRVPHKEMAKDFEETDEDRTPAFDADRLLNHLQTYHKKRNETSE